MIARFTADDDPVDTVEVEVGDGANERLAAQELAKHRDCLRARASFIQLDLDAVVGGVVEVIGIIEMT